MAAPTPTVRSTPGGIKLFDGFSTKITFAADADLSIWEKTVQPPGMDGGDAVEQTTMHNVTYRTFAPRNLITLTECSGTAAYDPAVYDQMEALINVETTITITFPDGSTCAFYGFLRTFEPQSCEEGSQPEANFSITPTNWDPAADVEAGQALTSVEGT